MSNRVRGSVLTILALIATALAVVGINSTSASGLGLVKCDVNGNPVVGVAKADPIVNHNGTAATTAHQHQFFGQSSWLTALSNPNTANYSDLIGGPTNCRLSTDTAAYWIPTLKYKASSPKAGQIVPVTQFSAYYRPWFGMGSSKFGPGVAYPADTRLVTSPGNEMWNCGQNSGTRSVRLPNIPDCTGLSGGPGETLTAHVEFPSCWDGVTPNHQASDVGDTRDNAHYAYTIGSGSSEYCPSTHPIKTIQLQETIQFAYVGDGTDLVLTSDAHNNTSDGRSLHADFWNTWDQAALEEFTTKCINDATQWTEALCDR